MAEHLTAAARARQKHTWGNGAPYWTRTRIIDAMHTWVATFGEAPSSREWNGEGVGAEAEAFRTGDWPGKRTVRRAFGSWSAALAEADLEPKRHTNPGCTARGPRTRIKWKARALAAEREAHELRRDLEALSQLGKLNGRERHKIGPVQVTARIKAVAEARTHNDRRLLHGALIDLASACIAWADRLTDRQGARPATLRPSGHIP